MQLTRGTLAEYYDQAGENSERCFHLLIHWEVRGHRAYPGFSSVVLKMEANGLMLCPPRYSNTDVCLMEATEEKKRRPPNGEKE